MHAIRQMGAALAVLRGAYEYNASEMIPLINTNRSLMSDFRRCLTESAKAVLRESNGLIILISLMCSLKVPRRTILIAG